MNFSPLVFRMLMLFMISLPLCAQEVNWHAMDSSAVILLEKTKLENKIRDSTALVREVQRVRMEWMQEDHWLTHYEIPPLVDSVWQVNLFAGPKFHWKSLRTDSATTYLLDFLKIDSRKTQDPLEWINPILDHMENNGYPFSAIHFDSLEMENGALSGRMLLDPGPRIRIDSISIKGYDKLPKPFLRLNLGLSPGRLYSEKRIRESANRINRVEFVRYSRSPQVLFSEEKNILYLYLEEEKNNSFDGIAGLNSLPDGGITITGELDLRLLNSFKGGEDLRIRWRRPGEEMQMLDLSLQVPYPFNLPLSLGGDLDFLQQDSSFINLFTNIYTRFYINPESSLSIQLESRRSAVLNEETAISGSRSFSSNYVKLGLLVDRTNHFTMPTRGLRASAEAGSGARTSENQRENQWISRGDIRFYQPVFKRFLFYGRTHWGWLYGDNLLPNELFRLGGVQTIRGFNEQSLFADFYVSQTVEARYLLDRFSYFQVLADFARLENNSSFQRGQNWLTGLGAGMSFRTEFGILQLIYAVGRVNEQSFDFQSAKIHIGYISRF